MVGYPPIHFFWSKLYQVVSTHAGTWTTNRLVPTLDCLHTLLQLARHATDAEFASPNNFRSGRKRYSQYLDKTIQGNKLAYASIKEHAMPIRPKKKYSQYLDQRFQGNKLAYSSIKEHAMPPLITLGTFDLQQHFAMDASSTVANP